MKSSILLATFVFALSATASPRLHSRNNGNNGAAAFGSRNQGQNNNNGRFGNQGQKGGNNANQQQGNKGGNQQINKGGNQQANKGGNQQGNKGGNQQATAGGNKGIKSSAAPGAPVCMLLTKFSSADLAVFRALLLPLL